MGRNKKRTGITYKLVQLPREDDEDDELLIGGEHNINSTTARVELVPEHELRAHTYNPERANTRRNYASRPTDVENWAGEWYDEGEDEDWEEGEDEQEDDDETLGGDAQSKRRRLGEGDREELEQDEEEGKEEEEQEQEDEPLFEDAVEGGVTDDFIRQLVLGTGVGGGDEDGEGFDDDMEDFDWDEEDEDEDDGADEQDLPVDGEVWRLLSEEEREGLMAAHRRGTQRQRKTIPAHVDPTSGKAYPKHETSTRAIDRQFTEMMKEFNTDARINEVDTVDLRTQGPLSVNKYLPALQEFVSERAGIDLETADLNKNRGLMHQLRILSHREGAFDVDPHEGGVYFPALPSEKQERFAENFMLETEQIREQAMARIRQREAAAARALKEGRTPEELDAPATATETVEDEEYEIVKLPPRAKTERMDCETVVSTMSTYYNQPNIIRPPPKKTPTNTRSDVTGSKKKKQGNIEYGSSEDDDDSYIHHKGTKQASAPLIIERVEGETKEEKRLRRQAVKAAQRERRQEKSALKKAYKAVSATEAAKASVSSKAKRTVHFS